MIVHTVYLNLFVADHSHIHLEITNEELTKIGDILGILLFLD